MQRECPSCRKTVPAGMHGIRLECSHWVHTKCLDKKPTCQDCRLQVPEKVKSAHFTICQKPWTCTQHLNPKNKVLCEIFHDKWFALRNELELQSDVDVGYRKKNSRFKNSLGMCSGYGDKKYIPIPLAKLTGKVG